MKDENSKSKMKKKPLSYRCILNDDGDGLKVVPPPHDVSMVAGPVASLKGTPVDCLCWLVAGEVASYKSEVLETIYDRYGKSKPLPAGTGGGTAVFDGTTDVAYSLYQQGIDYLPLLIDHAHRAGIAFYASFRMNDIHHRAHPDSCLAPDFWKKHQEYRIWGETDAYSYYNGAMDYSFEEVRERKLAAIAEVARNYAVDGIELDMSREPYFFQPDEAWEKRSILTEFLIQVRARLKAAGRDIPIMVRTLFREDRLRHGGMDLRTWIADGRLDILVCTDLCNTFRADLEPWQSLCRTHKIPFYPSLEGWFAMDKRNFYDIFPNPDAPRHSQVSGGDRGPMLRAAAQNFAAQDIAGLALYNLWPRPNNCEPPAYLTELFNFLHREKRYQFWEGLPLYVEAQRPPQYHQTIEFPVCGADIGGPDSRVTLCFRQMAVASPHCVYEQPSIVPPGLLKYTLNGVETTECEITRREQPAGRIPSGHNLKSHELIEIRLKGTALRNGMNQLAFSMPKVLTDREPYVYIFELCVNVQFAGASY